MSNRTVGIEIEVLVAADLFDVRNHIRHSNVLGEWTAKLDGSVRSNECDATGQRFSGMEFVSGILPLSSVEKSVEALLNFLENYETRVNDTCGLHVHVDASGLTAASVANVAFRYGKDQKAISKWLAESRQNNEYARPLLSDGSVMDTSRSVIEKGTKDVRALTKLSRYSAVNLSSVAKHGTIEFRQHHGSLRHDEIVSWVNFCHDFVVASTLTPVQATAAIVIAPMTTQAQDGLRANAIIRQLILISRALDQAQGGIVSKEALARASGDTEEDRIAPQSIPGYIKILRDKYLSRTAYAGALTNTYGKGYSFSPHRESPIRTLEGHISLEDRSTIPSVRGIFDGVFAIDAQPGWEYGQQPETVEHLLSRR